MMIGTSTSSFFAIAMLQIIVSKKLKRINYFIIALVFERYGKAIVLVGAKL